MAIMWPGQQGFRGGWRAKEEAVTDKVHAEEEADAEPGAVCRDLSEGEGNTVSGAGRENPSTFTAQHEHRTATEDISAVGQ